ncbi:hypothetical protein BJ742DRAFT_814034, partial [Cladochytrium replicatum]
MKALEVSGEVSVQLSSFQADGKARYANDIATSSTSITFVYFVEYFADSEVISMTSTADFDGEDPASRKKYLTPLGRSAFERLSTNPNSWREDCGDSVLQKKIRGGKVFITFSVIFKTVDDKTSLSAEINGKFKDSVSLKANVEFSNSVKQSDAKVVSIARMLLNSTYLLIQTLSSKKEIQRFPVWRRSNFLTQDLLDRYTFMRNHQCYRLSESLRASVQLLTVH